MEILLVEDNAAEARLIEQALKEVETDHEVTLHTLSNANDALAFLTRKEPFGSMPRPDIILLEISIPQKDGIEVLSQLKADPELRNIPVLVLAGSEAPNDVIRAYDLGANCYLRKPFTWEGFCQTMRAINEFWFTSVVLPSQAR